MDIKTLTLLISGNVVWIALFEAYFRYRIGLTGKARSGWLYALVLAAALGWYILAGESSSPGSPNLQLLAVELISIVIALFAGIRAGQTTPYLSFAVLLALSQVGLGTTIDADRVFGIHVRTMMLLLPIVLVPLVVAVFRAKAKRTTTQ